MNDTPFYAIAKSLMAIARAIVISAHVYKRTSEEKAVSSLASDLWEVEK